jgi:hypothetical protein
MWFRRKKETIQEPVSSWELRTCAIHGKFEGNHIWCYSMPLAFHDDTYCTGGCVRLMQDEFRALNEIQV